MGRSICAVAVERPVWARRGLHVEGPDEDEFTMVVAALERLFKNDPAELEVMGRRALESARPEAASDIARFLVSLLERRPSARAPRAVL